MKFTINLGSILIGMALLALALNGIKIHHKVEKVELKHSWGAYSPSISIDATHRNR